jgi:hypothetical protein
VTSQRVIWIVIGAAFAALAVWIMRNTYWDEFTLPTSLRGDAARYQLYAAESLAKNLGAQTSRDQVFSSPATTAVVYLSDWTWDLGNSRRSQLERWVEAGGRLVIDNSVYFQKEAFRQWSGIQFFTPEVSDEERKRRAGDEVDKDCSYWDQSGTPPIADDPVNRKFLVCSYDSWERVRASRATSWAIRDRDGNLAVRVQVGRGSVTAIAAQPFVWRSLLAGEHADLFVAVTQLHGGDHLHFLSEARHPSLVALAWRHGAAVIVLAMLALLLALWRNGVRFGPLAIEPQPLRRSLVEQIRGTGEFTLRHGGGALHAAAVRALTTAARRRIPGFTAMDAADQAAAMAQAGSTSTEAMVSALQPTEAQRSRHLLSTVALLETVRRRILSLYPGQINGK